MASRHPEQHRVADIHIGERQRRLDDEAVQRLMASMAEIGLRTPITVRVVPFAVMPDGEEMEDALSLVAGAHRLEAAKRLGWEKIDCIVVDDSDVEAQMWEIAENLHRAELTALERSEHIARWIKLEEERQEVSSHVATKPAGRPAGGVRAAARELHVDKDDAHRAMKVAGLTEGAKEAAREMGLDDNRKALLRAAKEPAERQETVIRTYDPLDDWQSVDKQVSALMSAWNRAGPEAREKFLEQIDRPLFDKTTAGRDDDPRPAFLRRA